MKRTFILQYDSFVKEPTLSSEEAIPINNKGLLFFIPYIKGVVLQNRYQTIYIHIYELQQIIVVHINSSNKNYIDH